MAVEAGWPMLRLKDENVILFCTLCGWEYKLLDKHTQMSLTMVIDLSAHPCNRDVVKITRRAKMPPVVYGPGYGKPQADVQVTSTVLVTDVQCLRCEKWIETWLPEDRVQKDLSGYSVPPKHECEEKK